MQPYITPYFLVKEKATHNDVLLAKIGLGRFGIPSIIIYLLSKGFVTNPSLFINQAMGIWDIYGYSQFIPSGK